MNSCNLKSNDVIREEKDDGSIQFNCYLKAAKKTGPDARERVYNVVIGPRGQNAKRCFGC